MAVRALACPWSVFGTLGGGGAIRQYPVLCQCGPIRPWRAAVLITRYQISVCRGCVSGLEHTELALREGGPPELRTEPPPPPR
eukprot:5634597-Prymnesium_polylepis.1